MLASVLGASTLLSLQAVPAFRYITTGTSVVYICRDWPNTISYHVIAPEDCILIHESHESSALIKQSSVSFWLWNLGSSRSESVAAAVDWRKVASQAQGGSPLAPAVSSPHGAVARLRAIFEQSRCAGHVIIRVKLDGDDAQTSQGM